MNRISGISFGRVRPEVKQVIAKREVRSLLKNAGISNAAVKVLEQSPLILSLEKAHTPAGIKLLGLVISSPESSPLPRTVIKPDARLGFAQGFVACLKKAYDMVVAHKVIVKKSSQHSLREDSARKVEILERMIDMKLRQWHSVEEIELMDLVGHKVGTALKRQRAGKLSNDNAIRKSVTKAWDVIIKDS